MLTKSHGLPAKLRRMRAQGVHHYSIKPIKRQDLYAVIAEVLAEVRAAAHAPAASARDAVPQSPRRPQLPIAH